VVAAVRALNKSVLPGSDRESQFTRHSQTQKMVMQIVDSQSGAVLNQISPEQILPMMKDMGRPGSK
jgi:uncharacterized FlaG/YvyC family protein